MLRGPKKPEVLLPSIMAEYEECLGAHNSDTISLLFDAAQQSTRGPQAGDAHWGALGCCSAISL